MQATRNLLLFRLALLQIFPKGKMIPKNSIQRVFRHFLKQQNCAVEILDTMEYWGVLPDKEIHEQVIETVLRVSLETFSGS